MVSMTFCFFFAFNMLILPVVRSSIIPLSHVQINRTGNITSPDSKNLDFVFPDSPLFGNKTQLTPIIIASKFNITASNETYSDYDDDKIGGNVITTILG